ncbi:D-tyrosyl-tRNA(Tyr) deacylase [Aspergillus melleus]|uniref:D-tyrosyl-tRNA(Tyr) deacylase n=1 Tax=Aspergillus melleus TaxID=138277 RepID=A0ACC3B9R0_9EURO|nr:D-tyrosyl-tRNA(Tyr) deacylase [Aspergillus melleus]
MKAVLQRVKSASVTVDGQQISSIGRGLLVLAGVGKEDTEKDMDTMVGRILRAKLWPADEDGGQWKKNVQDIEGEVLCVSQFTLYGDMKKAKPNFNGAADVETARRLYDYFFQKMRAAYKPERVQNGVFQAMMDVDLRNDGPVGVNYRSHDAAVTIEISTKLPPSEEKEKKKESDESTEGEKKSYEFKLPASLLE